MLGCSHRRADQEDRHGGLDFLDTVPNPDDLDLGYFSFMNGVDAVLVGRITFDSLLSFDLPWHYSKPVFVLSSIMEEVPGNLQGKVEIVSGRLQDVVQELQQRGLSDLYIDGGRLIQGFLAKDMIDELTVTQIPILIGGGTHLYSTLPTHLDFRLVKSEILLQDIVQSHYRRVR